MANYGRQPDGRTFEERLQETIKRLKEAGLRVDPKPASICIPDARASLFAVIMMLCRKHAPQWRDGYEEVAGWLSDNKGKGLLLSGPCGTGKTFLAHKVIPVLIRMHYYDDIVVTNYYKATELNTRYEEATRYKQLLTIDDIGTEGERVEYGERRMVFPEIVDLAEQRAQLLIVTTNLGPKELAEKYGERTLSRLTDITRYVMLTGEDIRKSGGKEE